MTNRTFLRYGTDCLPDARIRTESHYVKLPHIIRYILTVRETHRRHVKQTADILLALQNRAVNKLRSARTQAPASPKVSFRQAIHGLWQL